MLFLAHFYTAGLNLSEKLSLKTISEIDEQNFKKQQIKLVSFSKNLLTIKNKFGATLDEINNYCNYLNLREKELIILIKDVLTFSKNRDFDFIKNKFSTFRKLSSMRPRGPGILKRINKFESLNSFKKYFSEYLKNLKEKICRFIYRFIRNNTTGIETNFKGNSKVKYTIKKVKNKK